MEDVARIDQVVPGEFRSQTEGSSIDFDLEKVTFPKSGIGVVVPMMESPITGSEKELDPAPVPFRVADG